MDENINLNEFINDWEINEKDGIITHKSGIGFRYIAIVGRVEIINLPKWYSSEMRQGKSLEECDDRLRELNNQFYYIQESILKRKK